jgi:hypothetical protein
MFRRCILATVSVAAVFAQPPGGQPNPNLKSTEVLPDHRVVFRIYAPKARSCFSARRETYANYLSYPGIAAGDAAK